jgi:ABC-type multidrug transport system ATPase subunit
MTSPTNTTGGTSLTRPTSSLEAVSLGKRYGRTWALRECSLHLPIGRVAALVGPNGAGKTTLLQLAVGLLRPSAGAVRVFGRDPRMRPLEGRSPDAHDGSNRNGRPRRTPEIAGVTGRAETAATIGSLPQGESAPGGEDAEAHEARQEEGTR